MDAAARKIIAAAVVAAVVADDDSQTETGQTARYVRSFFRGKTLEKVAVCRVMDAIHLDQNAR